MQVSISFDKSTVNLGSPVTVTYSAVDCATVTLTIDNFPNPIDVSGDQVVSGTMKVLPLTDGTFNVQILGSGRYGFDNSYLAEITETATCQVN